MKKKLTLLIFLFPVLVMAQNGSITFDLHPKKNKVDTTQQPDQQNSSDNNDDQQEQKPKKEKKAKAESTTAVQDDWKRNGLFKLLFHAGINGAQIDGDNYAGYDQVGLDAGVGLMLRFHKYLSFTTSLDYSMKGARQHLVQDPNAPTLSRYQVQWDYMEVPLMLNVEGKNLVMFGLGVQPGVMVRYKEWDENGDNVTNDPPYGQPRLFDLEGIAALHFIVWQKLLLGIKFSYSIIKIRGTFGVSRLNGEYNNLLTFEAGYLLNPAKKKK